MYIDFDAAFNKVADSTSEIGNEPTQVLLYIYVEKATTGIKEKHLLEEWNFSYLPDKTNNEISTFECPESVQLLRCIFSTLRLLPAFHHNKTLSRLPNQFSMNYAIATKPITAPTFTDNTNIRNFPKVVTAQGTIEIKVNYRVSCKEFNVCLFIF